MEENSELKEEKSESKKEKSESKKEKAGLKKEESESKKEKSESKKDKKAELNKSKETDEELEREAIVIQVSKHGGFTKVTRTTKPKLVVTGETKEKTDEKNKSALTTASSEAVKRSISDTSTSGASSYGANLKNIKIPKLNRDKSKTDGSDKKEERRPGVLDQKERPKTVKTYNSKFRSTG